MPKWTEDDRMVFQKGLEQYVYLNKDGRLDLDDFCSVLSSCFDFDGVLQLSAGPRAIFDLLTQIIWEEEGEEKANKWIQRQNLVDWTPAHARTYPDGFRTYIHISALVTHGHTWIYNIGAFLMGVSDDSNDSKYYAWAKEEWFFTHLFIEGYHNSLFEFVQNFDAQYSLKGGYSAFEAFHLAKKKDIDYEEAVSQLGSRNDAKNQALARIDLSIGSGFYLEAITLEECFISNCIYNFLLASDQITKDTNFHDLLKRMFKANVNATTEIKAMFLEIDNWRGHRNNAIHGFISSLSSEIVASTQDFFSRSKETAEYGQRLCGQINEWYAHKAARFQQVKFSRKSTGTPLH